MKLYRKLGFGVTREFNYFIQKKADLHLRPATTGSVDRIERAAIPELLDKCDFSDFVPSWQNSHESKRRGLHRLSAMAVRDRKKVINIPTDAAGVTAFLSFCNIKPAWKQFEMVREFT